MNDVMRSKAGTTLGRTDRDKHKLWRRRHRLMMRIATGKRLSPESVEKDPCKRKRAA